jgi:hypothetical protein
MMKPLIAAAAVLAAALAGGTALAQSHSTGNMANPPQGSSDNKAGTEATPGHTATADRQDAHHGAKDAQANKPNGKWHPPVRKATDDKGKVRNDIGSAQAGNVTKEAMQVDPSESQVSPTERQALDVSPGKK